MRATGITKSTFSSWKSGKYTPKNEKLQKIADYFGVSLEYLRTGNIPDFIYSDDNVDFLIEVQHYSKDIEFVNRMKRYMSLSTNDKKSVDDMIDFLYNKEKGKRTKSLPFPFLK